MTFVKAVELGGDGQDFRLQRGMEVLLDFVNQENALDMTIFIEATGSQVSDVSPPQPPFRALRHGLNLDGRFYDSFVCWETIDGKASRSISSFSLRPH